jgi:hypothetical protein
MAWEPQPASQPPPGWWTKLETAEQWETRRWVDGIAADLWAERIERLRARVHEVDMKAAGALSRDRWDRIQRRSNQRVVRSYGGYQVESWGARPEVEHSGHWGRVLGVR